MSSSKKNNARIEKWRKMITQGVYKDPQLLKSRIRKGIPAAMRMLAWPQIVQLPKFVQEKKASYTYDKLVNSFSNNIYEISLDIPRTFPGEQDAKVLRKSLSNVLKAISIVYPRVGYCQGMNFLALRLLQVLQDEDAFWLMHFLFEYDPSMMSNFIDPKRIDRENHVFAKLLQQKLPKIQQLFEKQKIGMPIFTVKWFMTFYSGVLPQQFFRRVFEVFLNEGWTVIYGVALTFLKLNEEKILKNEFEGNLYLLNCEIYQVKSIDDFLEEAFKWELHMEEISKLSEEYERSLAVRGSMRDSRLRKHKEVANRETLNKQVQVRKPQHEQMPLLTVPTQPEEVTFQVFLLLNAEE